MVEVVAHRRQSDADGELLQGGGVVDGSEEIPLGAFRSEAPSRNDVRSDLHKGIPFRLLERRPVPDGGDRGGGRPHRLQHRRVERCAVAATVLHGRGEQDDLAFLSREGRMVPGPVQSEVAVQRGRRVGKSRHQIRYEAQPLLNLVQPGLRPFRRSIDVVCHPTPPPLRRLCRLCRWKCVEWSLL